MALSIEGSASVVNLPVDKDGLRVEVDLARFALRELIERMMLVGEVDQRCVSQARTNAQQAFMWLEKSLGERTGGW